MPVVTLLTDFGMRDSYVAQVKGVILGNCPDCRVIDVTHEIRRHDILQGSFLLETAVPYFPVGTIHVGIVDPGVGGAREPIVIKCRKGFFVGPNNGLLARAAAKLGVVGVYRIRSGIGGKLVVSATFNGRDVFAIAAGKLASGLSPEKIGLRTSEFTRLTVPTAKVARGVVKCNVLHVDVFGNVITSFASSDVAKFGVKNGEALTVRARVGSFRGRFVRTYSDVGQDELAVLIGSQGYLEVARREQDASRLLEVGPLDQLEITVGS